jgi:glycosyltransferase involved in cell wall biosynthesis
MDPQRVLIVQRRITEYRVPLFSKLRESLNNQGITLDLLHGVETSAEAMRHDTGHVDWAFKAQSFCPNLFGGYFNYPKIRRSLLNKYHLIISTHENRFLLSYRLILRRKVFGQRFAFWGHGANFQGLSDKSETNYIRKWSMLEADWWFAYTVISVQRIQEAGFPPEKITCLNNTVDVSRLIGWRESITPIERVNLVGKVGLRGNHLGIFLGSLTPAKRLDFLFKISDLLRARFADFELLIVGDGPLRDKVRDYAITRQWVHWVGAKHDREKALHLSLGKVMLNPGMVGLGILDSFAMGLPIVTTDCKIHSPEIAYLESGRNGLMTENNVEAFVEGVERLLLNPELQQNLASEAMKDSSRYLMDIMVQNFCDGIIKALGAYGGKRGQALF